MRTIHFISDALADRMMDTANANKMLGFQNNIARGAELNDAALLNMLDLPIESQLSSELIFIDRDDIYLIGNFVMLNKYVKEDLMKYRNYIIYEHDHKYTPTRNPFSFSKEGIVPPEHLINVDFYKGARKVICLTEWHENQVKVNTGADTTNIHGSIWTQTELDWLDQIRSNRLRKIPKFAIFSNSYKNPRESVNFAIRNKLDYNMIPTIKDRPRFMQMLCMHKGLIFFPVIPETCSRILVEAKMLGLQVFTNKNSGAANEYWWELSGQELTNEYRNTILPNAITLFKKLLTE